MVRNEEATTEQTAALIGNMIGWADDHAEVAVRLNRFLERGGSLIDAEEQAFEVFLQLNRARLRFLQSLALLDGESPVDEAVGGP